MTFPHVDVTIYLALSFDAQTERVAVAFANHAVVNRLQTKRHVYCL